MPAFPGPVKLTPGEELLTYKSGAGFLAAPNNWAPVAFKSLQDLKQFWKSTAGRTYGPLGSAVYSIKSVSPDTAICVNLDPSPIFVPGRPPAPPLSSDWLLYVAPSASNSARHYVTAYLKTSFGPRTGPVIPGLSAAKYVAIVNDASSVLLWPFDCIPATNLLIQI